MRRSKNTRSSYADLLLAVLLVLFAVLAVFAVLGWTSDGLSCASDSPSDATVTLPPTSETSTTTSSTSTTSTTLAPVAPEEFDGPAAMKHLEALAEDIGPRKSGTQAEDEALGYATAYLHSLGYEVVPQDVSLPGGLTSRNLSATKHGASDSVILVGAHIDTVAVSPGGNDNASGVAVLLELARDLRHADITATVEFVVFGAEEMTDSNPDHHHYGSRQYVEGMSEDQSSQLVAMISLDMVGYGSVFNVRTMNQGPQLLRDTVETYSHDHGLPASYLKDGGKYGWSDHEPFELAGYPAVWLEWREDPHYHTARDTYSHCDPEDVLRAGTMVLGFLTALTQDDLDALAAAREL